MIVSPAMAITSEDAAILRQAVERQLAELDAQRVELQNVLQRLNVNGAGRRRPQTRKAAEPAPVRRTRRRKVMTAAQRKAVSERMRKYWASKRKS